MRTAQCLLSMEAEADWNVHKNLSFLSTSSYACAVHHLLSKEAENCKLLRMTQSAPLTQHGR